MTTDTAVPDHNKSDVRMTTDTGSTPARPPQTGVRMTTATDAAVPGHHKPASA